MAYVTISLPDALQKYVEETVAAGNFSTAEDYLSQLVLEDKRRKAEHHLEAALIAGLESGDSVPVTPEFWANLWERVEHRRNQPESRPNAA